MCLLSAPSPLLLFVLLGPRSSALRVLPLFLRFLPGRWLLPCGCCRPPPFCVSPFSSLPLGAPFLLSPLLLLCSCLLAPRLSAVLAACCPPPPPPVRPWCLVLSGVAALRCPSVKGFAVPCCRVPCCVSCCGASPCCVVGCCALCGFCWGVCLCVVLCCWLLLRVVRCPSLCRPVGLFAVWFAVWFWSALPCAVLCCVLGAALCRAAAWCAARSCAVVCCVVLFRSFGAAACDAVPPWRCPSPWGPVLCGAVVCGVPPRYVLCAVRVLSWHVGACCCSPLCFVLCVSWVVVLCVPCPLRSVPCCAVLCWCACAVLFVWCMLLLVPGAVGDAFCFVLGHALKLLLPMQALCYDLGHTKRSYFLSALVALFRHSLCHSRFTFPSAAPFPSFGAPSLFLLAYQLCLSSFCCTRSLCAFAPTLLCVAKSTQGLMYYARARCCRVGACESIDLVFSSIVCVFVLFCGRYLPTLPNSGVKLCRIF